MLAFATEFPVGSECTSERFLQAFREWLVGSPHTRFVADGLAGMSQTEWSGRTDHENLETMRLTSTSLDGAACRYTKTDGDIEWATDVVFSQQDGTAWIGLRTSCESHHPATHLPAVKKPVLVRVLLKHLGGGEDGALVVDSSAVRLTKDDVELAAACMSGQAKCRLPIVYVSASFQGGHVVDVDAVARSLAGMAHVLVEPDRSFSWRLRHSVDGDNVYGGTIGIYWPDGAGRRAFFLGPQFGSSSEIESALTEEVQTALTNRRALARCTWSALREQLSRRAIAQLREQGSTEVERYIAAFDSDLRAKESALMDAEREIARLAAHVRRYEGQGAMRQGLPPGTEQDLYEGEVAGIVRDALADAAHRVPKDSRREHVLASIVQAMPERADGFEPAEQLKALLRDYRAMDARVRRGLVEMGFDVSEEGKHYKLVFRGDDRYTFTLPKSGSDHRGGLNAATDLARLLF